MSLVQAYVCSEFAVVGGDQRAVLENGSIIEHFVKVHKINSTTIIGMSGTIEGNSYLFSDYINPDFTMKSLYNDKYGYNKIVHNIIEKYKADISFFNQHPIHSIICGYNGNEIICTSIFHEASKPENDRIIQTIPQYSEIRIVSCGEKSHYDKALEILDTYKRQAITPGSFQIIFKKVIENGVKLDSSINKRITFEIIRKDDF